MAGKEWGNPCWREHVNEDGKTLRYQRKNATGELEHGNCVACNKIDRPKYKAAQRLRYVTDPVFAEANRVRARESARRLSATGHTRARVKGLTLDQLDTMYEAQGSACAACGKPEVPGARGSARLHIDHDHSCCPTENACGKCVRGLLCQSCNQALGLLDDNPERVRALAAYIERTL